MPEDELSIARSWCRSFLGRALQWSLISLILVVTPANALDLEQYDGKVVVLDFWASWCAPCLRSFPWMNAMQSKYAQDGLVIIAVNVDANKSDATAFLERNPAEFAIHFDAQGQLAREYGVKAMPTSVIIDRSGKIAAEHRGFKLRKTDAYEATLKKILFEPVAAPSQAGQNQLSSKVMRDAN